MWKCSKLAWYHHFTHIACVERVSRKTGCTLCTKRTISLEVWGFRTRTHLLQRDFIFLNLFELHTFCVFKMHHSKAHHKISTISDFIWYSSCIYFFFELVDPKIGKCNQTRSPGAKTTCFLPLSPASLYLAFMRSMFSLVNSCILKSIQHVV